MDESKIQKEVKKLLDKFAVSLEKVDNEKSEDYFVDRKIFERVEGEGKEGDENFRVRFLENAPKKNKDFVLVEKGDWK